MLPEFDAATLTGWFAGRLPDDWFTGAPDVSVDRDEILVVGTVPEPDYPDGADAAAQGAARRARIQRFREGDVESVVGADVVPQFPDARQEEIVRIPPQGEAGEVRQGLSPELCGDLACYCTAPYGLCHLGVKQIGCMQRLSCPQQSGLYDLGRRRAE